MENFNKDKIMREIQKNSQGKIDMNALNKAAKEENISGIVSSLPEEDKQKIIGMLNDKKALADLLNNPKVKGLFGKFIDGGK